MSDLTQEEVRCLEMSGIFLSAPLDGRRKVSTALLCLPDSIASSIDLPMDLESIATLVFLGFTKTKAGETFASYASRPMPELNPDTILSFALGRLFALRLPQLRDVGAAQAMDILGIAEELKSTILDPAFANIISSKSLEFWLEDSMFARYWTLDALLTRLKKYAVKTLREKGGHERARIGGLFETAAAFSSSSSVSQGSTATASALRSTDDFHLPRAYVSVATEGPFLDDHVVLYKGKGLYELTRHADNPNIEGPFIYPDGSINMHSIKTYSGGDFNRYNDAWYWTEERQTAEQYRDFAARRNPCGESWLIRIQVPKYFMNSLSTETLHFGPDWKQMIWFCKKGSSIQDNMPASFDRYSQASDVIKGHICGKSPAVVTNIERSEVQTKITEDYVLKDLSGQKSTQVVIMKRATADAMAAVIRGKTHIEVFAPVMETS